MDENRNELLDCQRAIYGNEFADYIVTYAGELSEIRNYFDVYCLQLVMDYKAIIYSESTGNVIPSINKNGYRAIPKLYGLMDTSNVEDIGVLRLRRLPFLDLLGTEVLMGIIDTGIDYQNPLFQNADGSTRIFSMWDQSIQGENPPDDLLYGTYYTGEQINEALKANNPLEVVPSTDEDGHGTFLAGISGGNIDVENDFTGIAPAVKFVVVKLKQAKQYLRDFYGVPDQAVAYQENDIMLAIKFLILESRKFKRPLSICIGLGTSSGEHDGSSPLSELIDSVSNNTGICISAAAGNEGNIGHHYQGDIPYRGSEEVEIKVGEEDKAFTLELWSLKPSVFSVGIISPSGEVSQKVAAIPRTSVSINFVLEPTKVQVTYAILDTATGNEVVIIQFKDLIPGIWRIQVFNEYNVGTRYDMWLPISQFVTGDTYFLKPDPYVTLVETGTTSRCISTATYNNKNKGIYISSSRGYTLTDQIKPDVTAPGVNIYGPVGKNRFGTKTGSSIAAAHTAGVAALFLQWGIVDRNRLSINTSEIRALLIKGATRTDREYPNREWGFGVINAFSSFESIRSST